jgi:cation diffusion facilitator family transporter
MNLAGMDKRRLGYLEGVVSSVLNTVLFGFKIWVGAAAGSVAMVADAWHTLSDTFTSLVVILGFWISSRPADKEHPFGHGRAELIASIVIGTLLGVVGINFVLDSLRHLSDRRAVTYGLAATVVFSVSVILKEAMARFSIWAGKKTNSQSLIADGWHHRSDALASLLIIVGAFLGRKIWWIDGVLGLVVSALILHAAWQIIREASNALLGEQIDPAIEKKIRLMAAEATFDAEGLHHLHFHRYGDHAELTFHVKVPDTKSLTVAHDSATALERRILKEFGFDTTIHIEPVTSER